MDVPVNAEVSCVDGSACGRSTYVILNPVSGEVSGIVVETRVFPRAEHVVPVDMIRESTPQRIALRCTLEELEALPPFTEQEYLKGEDGRQNYEPGQWLFSPSANPVPSVVPIERRNIPHTETALRRGTHVQATDGHVGVIDDLVIDPVSSQITLLIIRLGGLLNQRNVTIPAGQIDRIADDTIFLKMDKQAVESLPDVPANR